MQAPRRAVHALLMRTFAVLWWQRKTHQVGPYKGLMSAVAERLFSMWGRVEEVGVEAAAVNRTRVCAYRTKKKLGGAHQHVATDPVSMFSGEGGIQEKGEGRRDGGQ